LDLRKRILVVEDSQIQLMVCTNQLKQLGFEKIAIAKNGTKAYSIIENGSIDVIISDWEMPEMNGLELLKKVRANPSHKDIPFIMLTIHKDDELNEEALKSGATDFIVKPGTPDIFQEKLTQLI
jgi:two-component system, chemotaxis family, chemotaxis protein CheY